MSSTVRFGLVLMAIALAFPNMVQAQLFRNIFDNCGCHTCQQPCGQCTCTAVKPVVETQYCPQQVVSYRDVQQTEYRQQAYWKSVPVTMNQQVTVDEGSYQKVWVPKLVAKQVPKTVYQQQLAYRTVPYQVRRRVPQVSTQLVPRQKVRYVAQQFQTAFVGGCTDCLPSTTAFVPSLPPVAQAPSVSPTAVAPHRTGSTVRPSVVASAPAVTLGKPAVDSGPVPDPKFMETPPKLGYEEWTTVESRRSASAQDDRLGGYRVAAPVNPLGSRTARRRSLRSFVPAPSAATVWQSRHGVVRR